MTPDPLTKLSACEWTRGATGRAYSWLTDTSKAAERKERKGDQDNAKARNPIKLTRLPTLLDLKT